MKTSFIWLSRTVRLLPFHAVLQVFPLPQRVGSIVVIAHELAFSLDCVA